MVTTSLLVLVVQSLVTARFVSVKGWFMNLKGGNWRWEVTINKQHPPEGEVGRTRRWRDGAMEKVNSVLGT